jgi:hypothetical protein
MRSGSGLNPYLPHVMLAPEMANLVRMADGMHLGDEVEIVTDAFLPLGASRGAVGVIVDDWADGSKDVEMRDARTGEVLAHFRAAEDDIRPYSGPISVKDAREHELLFGRGDDLGAPAGDPASASPRQFGGMPGSNVHFWPMGELPPDDAELTGEIPWELRDEPPTGPIFS